MTEMTATHTNLYEPDVVVDTGRFQVREMRLTWEKVATFWAILSKFRTLFSDLTRGDVNNFLRFVIDQNSVWLEVLDGGNLVGIICFENMHKVVDMDAHLIFFDRELSDKVPVCKRVVQWAFEKFPLQRITVHVPHFYYAAKRLVEGIGFTKEGTKRDAALIGGRWASVHMYGITRKEAGLL